MAEFLIPSGSKRISQLTSVSGISGSTSIPLVMGGNTVQISHTDFLNSTVFNRSNTFTQANNFNGITTFNNNVLINGNLTAEALIVQIVSSSVVYSSGSNIFGNLISNTHQFTGSVTVNGNVVAQSFTGSYAGNGSGLSNVTAENVEYVNVLNRPTLVSGSSQIDLTQTTNYISGIKDRLNAETLVSSSQQIKELLPSGTVSGSSQVSFNDIVDKPTLVSGSSQIQYGNISNIPNGIVSSSQQVLNYNIFATTGSNQFVGSETVVGSLTVTGSVAFKSPSYSTQTGLQYSGSSFSLSPTATSITLQPSGSLNYGNISVYATLDGRSIIDLYGSSLLIGNTTGNIILFGNSNSNNFFRGNSVFYNNITSSANIQANTFYGALIASNNVVSSSQQVLDYNLFALTASQNTFYDNQTIIGDVTVTGSLIVSSSNTFKNIGRAEFTQSLGVLGLQTVSGSIGISGSLKANGLEYPKSDNGEGSFIQTNGAGNLSLQYVKTLYETVFNAETTLITKGTPLYVSGSQGDQSKVYRADAGNVARMPVTYIAADDIQPSASGRGILLGLITGLNTTGYPAGTEVFAAVGGGWTATRPTGSAIIQILGIITKEGNGGQGVVLNPGPNNLPNLNSGSVWVGSSNGFPTAIATSSLFGGFATTGSNTFIGNQTITGSVDVTGSLEVNNDVKIENGYVVLTQVSQSLEFVDDAAAAAGGVPLGGLYRSGSFIQIRIS